MAAQLRSLLFAVFALLAVRVLGQSCTSYGIDYSNGGSYYIDSSSNQYFTFTTVFQGCNQESIQPVLVGPDNNNYACSAINTTPSGAQVTSSCGIPYSVMRSGTWRIIIQGQQVQVQRTVTFTVGVPETYTVTATPTVVVGITSTPRGATIISTIAQTQTLILVPNTVTAQCGGAGRTVTLIPRQSTTTSTSTVVRTSTDGQRTSYWTTTATSIAECHYPTKKRELAATAAIKKRAVAAVTVTVTQTTFTVTRTSVTTIPAQTVTEVAFRTITATVTPPASTVCNGGGQGGATVTVTPAAQVITQINVVYSTVHASATVWVGQTIYTTLTNSASATACWRAGGWYGK